MPFGAIFGAVVFGVLGLWLGRSILSLAWEPPARIAAVTILVLGPALALALLLRRPWARWAGLAAASALLVWAVAVVAARGAVVDHLSLLASLVTAVLLAVPSTGDLRRVPAPDGRLRRAAGRVLGAATALASVGLVSAVTWAFLGTAKRLEAAGDLRRAPADLGRSEAAAEGSAWLGFAAGLERGKAEAKPVLVDFYAAWCGPCRAMERRTFRHPQVVERLGEVVTVRVDAEDTRSRDGMRGVDIADRYGVSGYPTIALLDGDGRVLDRHTGYLTAEQFLRWLDRALARAGQVVAGRGEPPGLSN